MKSITQNMRYLQSLMSYAQRYGVKAASRKYNRARSFIYFWRKRWDGSVESLQCQSRRPHAHPNQHTEEELKLIRNMRRRNPDLGIIELWCSLRERGYSRCVESLYRVMKREGLMPQKKKVKKYTPKPYEQITHPGERIQIDVKVVPRKCIADSELRLYQYGDSEKNPYIIILPLHSFFHIDENMVFRYDKTAYRLRAILSNMIYEVFP